MIEDAVTRIEALYSALFAGDTETAATMLSDDFLLQSPQSLPYGGTLRGRHSLAEAFGRFLEYWDTPQFTLTAITSGAAIVTVHINLKARSRRTSKWLDTQVIEVWYLDGPNFSRMQAFYADCGHAAAIA